MFNTYTKVLCLFMIVFAMQTVTDANDKPEQMHIAVVKIQANNCSPSLGTAIEELLMSRLYETSLFVLMEKTQIDRIAQRSGFSDFDISNNDLMVKLGKILKVDKIVVGSVSKVGNYRIEIRTIDVKSGNVDVSFSTEADDEKKIEKQVNESVTEIERHYLGYSKISGNIDTAFALGFIYPMGKLRDYYSTAKGACFTVYINKLLYDNCTFAFSAGGFRAGGSIARVKSLYFFPLDGSVGLRFNVSKSFSVLPMIGAGMIYSRRTWDRNEKKTSGPFDYTTEKLIDMSLIARCEMSFFMFDRYSAFISGAMIMLPEKDSCKYLSEMKGGIKVLF
jgi:hypothetical protein